MVTSGDAELWVSVEGSGVPVLLISGGPGCCDYLEPVAALLRGHAKTIRFDARGCGRSSAASEYTVETSLADIERIREFVGAERWVVVGHSAGAEMALTCAMQFPGRVLGFACLAGGRVVDDRSWQPEYAAGRDAGLEPELDFAYPPNMDANRALNAAWKAYCRRPRMLREISQVRAPAVFVYGAQDIRPSWPAEQLAALLPDAEFVMLEEAGHNLWLTHAEELGERLRGFVGRFG